MLRICLLTLCLLVTTALAADKPARVDFNESGIARVDGRPFFPVGIFTYSLDGTVLAEVHELQFNTVITLTENHRPEQLDLLRKHGLMAICPVNDAWFPAVKAHPALLAWYLSDEPEGHGVTPEGERQRYLKVKQADPNHPVGLDHFLFEALAKYRDACDFTMTDVYPITANRDVPITHVGLFMDQARKVHGPNWPHWTYIQIFGGPETDGGKWAQPLPHEVRCLTYIALVHRAGGILYFSYWPKAPRTWDAVGRLNREVHVLTPWLVAKGDELSTRVADGAVQVRARRVGRGGLLLAVNTGASFVDTEITIPGAHASRLDMPFEPRTVPLTGGKLRDRFGPYETRAYTWGPPP